MQQLSSIYGGVEGELTRGCAPGPPARLQREDKCYHQQRRKDLTSEPMWPSAGSVLLPHTHGLTVCRQSPSTECRSSQAAAQECVTLGASEGEPIAVTAVAAAQ